MSALIDPPTPRKRAPDGFWKRLTQRRFLFISILVHVLFAIIATLFVVQTITAKRKLTFTPAPPSPNPSQKAAEHQVQMAKKEKAMSAPIQARRITSQGLAKISLPEMPALPTTDDFSPSKMAGAGGGGGAPSIISTMKTPSTSRGGSPVPFFGLQNTGGAGLEGKFYDFKRKAFSTQGTNFTKKDYANLLRSYSKSGNIPNEEKYFHSNTKLYSKFFIFPAIQDSQAGGAFKSPESKPGSWLAVYKGNFAAPDSGNYRFVGFGDNVMFVRTTGRLLLDASDNGYSGDHRTPAGNIAFPGKDNTPIFFGSWIELRKGEVRPIEVAVGDEGGIFCAGLFIQKQGTDYAQGARGIPKLPIFLVGALTDDEKSGLSTALLPDCVSGPIFPATKAAAPNSIFKNTAPAFP